MRLYLTIFSLFFSAMLSAQESVVITGKVTTVSGDALEGVTVRIVDAVTQTNHSGMFSLLVKQGLQTISFNYTGYISHTRVLQVVGGKKYQLEVILQEELKSLEEVIINKEMNVSGNLTGIKKELFESFPTASGNFEAVLKALPGVSSNNELSAQYSVRGGNFDENLLYINDFEIYRPLSIRNGQQEGLSFINPELISQVSFSAGGFGAKYGDKMSSVLDVRYRKPDSTEIIASASFIGLSATAKLPYKTGFLLLGIRNKSNKSILNKQRLTGSFEPRFYDVQLLFNQNISPKLNLSFLGNYNSSKLTLIPKSDETLFGTLNNVKRLNVNFSGREVDQNSTTIAGISMLFKPSNSFNLKLMASLSNSSEQESIDINSVYILRDEPDRNRGENDSLIRGIGSFYNFADNKLSYFIAGAEIKVYQQVNRHYLEWGGGYKSFGIHDQLNEFNRTDSSDFIRLDSSGSIIPDSSSFISVLADSVHGENNIRPSSLYAYLQNTVSVSRKVSLNAGIRSNYNSFTKEFLLSPRANVVYKAGPLLSYRLSGGMYAQPPFYRELRDFNGSLNFKSKAQRSIHFLAGADFLIKTSKNSLRFTSEIYYKKLSGLIPYKLENLRLRYFANQESRGYAAGADFSLSGDIVERLASNFRLSLMKTGEDITGDFVFEKQASALVKKEVGYLKRPTDQRVNFSINFQDRLLRDPTSKVHLSLLYGSKLPVGPPHAARHEDVFKIPAYRRVDIGFSKSFLKPENGGLPVLKSFNSFTFYAEVFNLLNINNIVSYLWVRDLSNNQYAVPGYLTSRQLNLKFIAKLK